MCGEKLLCMSINNDTDVDVKMIQEHSSQSGDFGEIDIFVYKFG